ncbi:MAG: XRE family transcriptional regulator, partial [Acutalibacteraceae bacterium]|nr:XRE family transcriptional regulator [Acutalibacteraceae bacterium]
MATFVERFKEALEQSGKTQSDICRLTGIGKSAISQYLKGSFVPKQQRVYAIAKALNVSVSWLMGYDVPPEPSKEPQKEPKNQKNPELTPIEYNPTHKIPVLGRISAGLPLYAEENIEDYIYTELNGGNEYFGLLVVGDSMNAARICDGDIIIVRQQEQVEDGEIAVVMVGDEDATVKRFHREGRNVFLSPQSFNP